jgi:WD40 repeat protein
LVLDLDGLGGDRSLKLLRGAHGNGLRWRGGVAMRALLPSPSQLLQIRAQTGDPQGIWDDSSRNELIRIDGPQDKLSCSRNGYPEVIIAKVLSISFDVGGSRIVSGLSNNSVRVWDADTGVELTSLAGHTSHVLSAVFAPDGQHIASEGAACVPIGIGF